MSWWYPQEDPFSQPAPLLSSRGSKAGGKGVQKWEFVSGVGDPAVLHWLLAVVQSRGPGQSPWPALRR